MVLNTFTLATWNINSVRIRMAMIKDFLHNHDIDILCLQEIKCETSQFPVQEFKDLGYEFFQIHGQKSYNGVAIISKIPFALHHPENFGGMNDCRHAYISLFDDWQIHNLYIPAGGDIPDVDENPKFAHKLQFIDDLSDFFAEKPKKNEKIIICGDFNIAPLECDVWSHKALQNTVSHTEIEITKMAKLQKSYNFIDSARHFHAPPTKIYSWWSYRNHDWQVHNRGRRLDHIWVSPELQSNLLNINHVASYRNFEKPSDHIPIILKGKY